MPTRTFSSFDAYFAANRHARMRGMVLGREREDWVITDLIANELSVQWGKTGSKLVVEGTPQLGGVTIFFPIGKSSVWGNGNRIDESSLMIVGPGDESCLANHSPCHWCSAYIPNALLTDANGDATRAVTSMRGVVHMSPHRFEEFRVVLEQLSVLARQSPVAFESAAAKKATEHKLIGEVRDLLAVSHNVEPTVGRHAVPQAQIIRRSMDFVDLHDGEYLSVEQLATAAGVSERTLRDAFQRYFGMAPVPYLNRRTLHQVRNALKAADPSVATVTEIATQFGVWHFGRLARDYRFLFGELPSETLRH